MYKYYLYLLMLAFTLINPSLINAQSGLSIDPALIELIIKPNKSITQTFTLKNQGQSGQFVANLHQFRPYGNQGHVTVEPMPISNENIPFTASIGNAKLAFGEPFLIETNKSFQFALNLTANSVSESTDSYLALVIKPYSEPNGQTVTTPAISALITSTITSDDSVSPSLEIVNFDLPLLHDNLSPLEIKAEIKNASNMLRVGGSLEILDSRGRDVYSTNLHPHLVLKDSTRLLQATSSTDSSSFPTEIKWHPKFYNIGLYRVKMTISSLGGSSIIESEKTIWILPIQASIIVCLLAFALWLLLKTYINRNKNKSNA